MTASARAIVHFLKQGPKGEDGVGAYALDLDNENVNIGLVARDGSLYPASGFNSGSTAVYVAGGADSSASLARLELLDSEGSVLATATPMAGQIWQNSSHDTIVQLTIDRLSATFALNKPRSQGERVELHLRGTISVSDSAGQRQVQAFKTASFMFQPPGADGVSPTVYELQPSASSVAIHDDGSRTPASVSCRIMKHSGASVSQVADLAAEGLRLVAFIGGSEHEAATQSVEAATDLEWRLYRGEDIIDRESLAFVRDGSAAVSVELVPPSLVFNSSRLAPKQTEVYVSRGGVRENPASVTVSTAVDGLATDILPGYFGKKTLRLTPSEGFDYQGEIWLSVVDREGVARSACLSIATSADGEQGPSSPVLVAVPNSVSYTQGSAMTVPMSFHVQDGDAKGRPHLESVFFGSEHASQSGGVSWDSASKSFSISDTATFEGVVTMQFTYRGLVHEARIPFSRSLRGDPGPEGLTYRRSEWRPDTEYRNDSALLGQQSPCFLDVVCKTDADGRLKGVWQCRQTHVSSSETDPEREQKLLVSGSPSRFSEHWEEMNMMHPVYTPLLVAEGAAIRFMQGNQLKIYDSEANLKAGLHAASGSYPIIYANPQLYPVAVDLYYCVTAGVVPSNAVLLWANNISISAANPLSIPNGQYLHLMYQVRWNDGTSTSSQRLNLQNNKGAVTVTSPMLVRFAASQERDTLPASEQMRAAPCTSAAKPYLWATVHASQLVLGPHRIAQQTSGTEQSTAAMFQVFDTGDATFGMPTGARLQLVAAPDSGLPRMDIYDESGNPAAIFDGTSIRDSGMLFGQGAPSAEIPIGSVTASQSPYNPFDAATMSATVQCDREGILIVPAFTCKLSATMGYHPSNAQLARKNSVSVLLYIDGGVRHSHTFTLDDGESLSATTIEFPERTANVSPGLHVVSLVLNYQYNDGSGLNFQQQGASMGSARLLLTAPVTFRVTSEMLRCRYFANGMAVGSSNDNYFMAWNGPDGNMQFIVENSSLHGLKVTSEGVFIKRPSNITPDKWSPL